jgi:hypothetical protein
LGSHRADRVVTLPNVGQAAVDQNGHFTASWRNWLAALDRTLGAAGTSNTGLAAAIAAIATALGSPDGTVANIPDQTADDFVIVSPDGTIGVTGTPASGSVRLILQQLADTGVGAALVKITRDAYGRVEGTHSATTDDLTEGSTNKYYTDERAQDAIGAAFAAGTQTGCTVTYNDAGNSISITVTGGGGGAMSLVGTATVAGSAATTLTMSGLDLATDGCYVIHAVLKNATASTANVALFFNGDTTATNYWEQVLSIDGTGANAVRGNDAFILTIDASTSAFAEITTRRDPDGYPRTTCRNVRGVVTSPKVQIFGHIRNNTANVTSISLSSAVASALAVGSYFKLYKVV